MIAIKRKKLEQVLEALELHLAHHEHGCVYLDPAVTTIKEALAQPEQEPVATLNISRFRGHLVNHDFDYFGELPNGTHALYTTPPKKQQSCDKRQWVGLTDEEASWCQAPSTIQTWKRIEANLKELNT